MDLEVLDDLVDLDVEGNSAIVSMKKDDPAGALTDEQIVAVVTHGKDVIKWINSVMEDAQKRLSDGAEIDGLKMVEGKLGNRVWADEDQAKSLIKSRLKADQYYKKTLITLPQAEKLLKGVDLSPRFKNRFTALTARKPGSPVMVLSSDERPDMRIDAAKEFEDLDEDLLA